MKKLLLTGLLLASAGLNAIDAINFDFWNKTSEPLYFEIGSEQYPPMGKQLTLINAAGDKDTETVNRILKGLQYGVSKGLDVQVQGDFVQSHVDTSKKTLILLSRSKVLNPGDRAVLVTVNAGKDIFLRIKEDSSGTQLFPGDNRKYKLGPQTGILMGWAGRSERNLPLANNVTQSDITINPNYIITEKPLSAQEKALLEAFGNQ